MVCVFEAEVIGPLTIDQAYVLAPAGPLAGLPVEFAQTCAGVGVIVGVDGLALMVTFALFVFGQPAGVYVTVSVSVAGPAAPAVHVTGCGGCPAVIGPADRKS